MKNRNKEIKVRLTQEEYEQLLERKTKARLAEGVRGAVPEPQLII